MDSGVNLPAVEGDKVDVFLQKGQLPFSMFNVDDGGPMIRLGDMVEGLNLSNLRQLKGLGGLRVSVYLGGESWYPAIVCRVRLRTKEALVYYVELESDLRCSDCPDVATVAFEAVRVPRRQVTLLKESLRFPREDATDEGSDEEAVVFEQLLQRVADSVSSLPTVANSPIGRKALAAKVKFHRHVTQTIFVGSAFSKKNQEPLAFSPAAARVKDELNRIVERLPSVGGQDDQLLHVLTENVFRSGGGGPTVEPAKLAWNQFREERIEEGIADEEDSANPYCLLRAEVDSDEDSGVDEEVPTDADSNFVAEEVLIELQWMQNVEALVVHQQLLFKLQNRLNHGDLHLAENVLSYLSIANEGTLQCDLMAVGRLTDDHWTVVESSKGFGNIPRCVPRSNAVLVTVTGKGCSFKGGLAEAFAQLISA